MITTRKEVTITGVAREAGVSTQTVSRVINNRPDVSPATRQRVQEVIADLGYRPNATARSLVSKRTRMLGLITADFSDYFFTQVISGAHVEARKHNYFFILGSTERNVRDEPEYVRLLTAIQVEGILFARPSTEPDSRHLSDLSHHVPVVTTAYHLPGAALTVVDVDNVDGARQATRHLLEHGHRRVAMISGPAGWKSVSDRNQGYRLALQSFGLPVDTSLVATGDWSYAGGYAAMQQLLARAGAFSAVFAQDDQMALGAIQALHQAGRRVPEDVSIVGYDDIPGAAYSVPALTTIRQPMRQVGEVATRLLIQAVEDPPGSTGGEVLLKTELVQRGSCIPVAG